ncbi:hypothetical protein F5883DRAFT_578740 [Diaporthe sp. PMI_573]|nr:hypothetical protein F5883DRAFT_578740 [Diaporthaceae sp. PMI_573]
MNCTAPPLMWWCTSLLPIRIALSALHSRPRYVPCAHPGRPALEGPLPGGPTRSSILVGHFFWQHGAFIQASDFISKQIKIPASSCQVRSATTLHTLVLVPLCHAQVVSWLEP